MTTNTFDQHEHIDELIRRARCLLCYMDASEAATHLGSDETAWLAVTAAGMLDAYALGGV